MCIVVSHEEKFKRMEKERKDALEVEKEAHEKDEESSEAEAEIGGMG